MIILISAKQGGGKTTMATQLKQSLEQKGLRVEILKFAAPLYEIHDMIWNYMGKYGYLLKHKKDGTLLQLLGTNWGRNTVEENLWVNLATIKAKQLLNEGVNVIIHDDCRFKNELSTYTESKLPCLTVRLEASEECRKVRAEMWREDTAHPSETDLDDYKNKFNLILDTEIDSIESNRDFVLKVLSERFGI